MKKLAGRFPNDPASYRVPKVFITGREISMHHLLTKLFIAVDAIVNAVFFACANKINIDLIPTQHLSSSQEVGLSVPNECDDCPLERYFRELAAYLMTLVAFEQANPAIYMHAKN